MLQLGVGGAYPNAGLEVGDLALAEAENYGDLGVRTPQGWESSELIGIPVIRGDVDYYNHFPLDQPGSQGPPRCWPTGTARLLKVCAPVLS